MTTVYERNGKKLFLSIKNSGEILNKLTSRGFLAAGMQCVIVLFPDHTHLLLEAMTMKIIVTVALFGTYRICLTNVHRSYRYEECNIKFTIFCLCCKTQVP